MKFSVLCLLLLCGSAQASLTSLPVVPAGQFADTVATTNVPMCAVMPSTNWKFNFMLECVPASNSVQVAWGRDANANGTLEPEETRLVIGRNRRGVFVENPWAAERFEQALPVYGMDAEDVSFSVSLDKTGVPVRFRAKSEFGSNLFPFWNDEPPSWLFDVEWNLVRVIVRGSGIASERIRLSVAPDATTVIFR